MMCTRAGQTGSETSGRPTMRTLKHVEAMREALREELQRDERVFLMGESIGGQQQGIFKVTAGLQGEFGPERVMETPLSEAAIVARPLARPSLAGARWPRLCSTTCWRCSPTSCITRPASSTTERRPDQRAGRHPHRLLDARRLGPHHCGLLDAWLMNTPGIKVVAPSKPADAKGLLKAIRDDNPVMVLEHTALY